LFQKSDGALHNDYSTILYYKVLWHKCLSGSDPKFCNSKIFHLLDRNTCRCARISQVR